MQNTIGMIGLGVMGSNLALNMANKGERVAAFNYTSDLTDQLRNRLTNEAIQPYYEIEEFLQSLVKPRKIFMMVTAGAAIDSVIEQITPYLDKGDIIMDGGNSHYLTTERRYDQLNQKGIHFLGVGISGGEVGALQGPAIMPGGDPDAYAEVAEILNKIAADVNGEPCCAYLGPKGAGHFVKMVHNGIEYADMQLIAEAYSFLRLRLKLATEEIAAIFHEWNQGELNSYLMEITANILQKKDPITKQPLVDVIQDTVGQKGTGMWTSIQAIEEGIPSPIITESLFARYLSSYKAERQQAETILTGPTVNHILPVAEWVESVRQALFMGKICAYAQGFKQYQQTVTTYGWHLPLPEIARIFRGGCVIRAEFLDSISDVYRTNPALSNLLMAPLFSLKTAHYHQALRKIVNEGISSGIALPCLAAAISYYDGYRTGQSNANLLQAQRDYFGAHQYERIDREGWFHTQWQTI